MYGLPAIEKKQAIHRFSGISRLVNRYHLVHNSIGCMAFRFKKIYINSDRLDGQSLHPRTQIRENQNQNQKIRACKYKKIKKFIFQQKKIMVNFNNINIREIKHQERHSQAVQLYSFRCKTKLQFYIFEQQSLLMYNSKKASYFGRNQRQTTAVISLPLCNANGGGECGAGWGKKAARVLQQKPRRQRHTQQRRQGQLQQDVAQLVHS